MDGAFGLMRLIVSPAVPESLGCPYPRTYRLVIIPGLLEEYVSGFIQPFSDARPHVESLGFKTDFIMVSGQGASAQNAEQIRKAVSDMVLAPAEKLVFIGYSKGATDALEALIRYPELSRRRSAVVTLASVISGTPIADDVPDVLKKLADRRRGSAGRSLTE